MKAIITTRFEPNNVAARVVIDAMTDNGCPIGQAQLPQSVQRLCREVHPSWGSAVKHMDAPAMLLRKLGWTVLDDNGDPYFKADRKANDDLLEEALAAIINLLYAEVYGTNGESWKSNAAFARQVLEKAKGKV